MKIAIAQTNIRFEQQEENLSHAAERIVEAASAHADLIIFPEMSFTGFSMRAEFLADLAPAAVVTIQNLARQCQIAIGFGCVKRAENCHFRNSYQIIDSAGNTIFDATKLHPFSYCHEDEFYIPGNAIATTTICGVPISALICYDLRFPEVFRLAAQNAHLILVPANWLSQRHAHWKTLLQARAIENQVYLLGINCTGNQGGNHFRGGSCLVNPEGEIVALCGEDDTLQQIDFTDDVEIFRRAFPTVHDARLDFYTSNYTKSCHPEILG